MRKRSVGFDAVAWLRRAAVSAVSAMVFAMVLTGAAGAETRTLKLYNTHTKERVSVTFKKNGRYLPGGLREANRFLRDWRRNEITKIDPELLDLVWEVYQKVRAKDHIYVVSSYRSPATNNMLRKRSKGVARNSQHTLGKAMDFYIPGVNLAKLRAAGLRKHVGGVGYYPRSGSPFVHMDTGRVRHWPRMTRKQLVRVFPNGKTLHVPSDGKPLKGYKLALAEAKSGKSKRSTPTLVASNSREIDRSLNTRNQNLRSAPKPTPPANVARENTGGGNLFASLFGGGNKPGAQDTARPGAVGGQQAAPQTATAAPLIENPPVPARKAIVAPPVLVASAAPEPAPAPNTLDSQRVALNSGQPSTASQPLDDRFQVARAPGQKPENGLEAAAQAAAARVGSGTASPVDDPVAAIAAATGTSVPSPTPAPRQGTTLAYASAAATPPELDRSLRGTTPPAPQQASAPRPAENKTASPARPSVSGRIPRNQIVDPLAGFASLPDRSEPLLLTGAGTARHRTFAWLSHPNQRQLKNVMKPGNRFVAASFEQTPYAGLRTDRFDGPAIVVLPVRFAR